MKIEVEFFDGKSTKKQIHNLSRLSLIKYLGIAGQGYKISLRGLRRALGMYLHYADFLDSNALNNNHFSQPKNIFYDQNELNNFSSVVGKGIADYLAKKNYNAQYTFSYEAAMKVNNHKIKGSRPDLLCFSQNKQFAIEAKGRSNKTVSSSTINKFKKQSKQGPITVHFSIASISYNLFSKLKCKFHDPVNEETEFNPGLLNEIAQQYYSGVKELYENNRYEEIEIGGVKYYRLYLISPFLPSTGVIYTYTVYPTKYPEILRELSLLVDTRIVDENPNFAETEFLTFERENVFVDRDGLGLML